MSAKLAAGVCMMAGGLYLGVLPPRLLALVGVVAAGGVGAIVWFQESILYIPVVQGFTTPKDNPQGFNSPAQHGLAFEDVTVVTPDGLKLHGWFLPAARNPQEAHTVLFCHENAGNIGLRLQEFSRVHRNLDVNQLVFDYRGYGHSEGAPSEEGLIADTLAALQVLQAKARRGEIEGRKIVLCGRSLGGAVAVHAAHELASMKLEYPPAAVIIENSFTSISDMVDAKFPFLNVPFFKERFLRLRWNSIGIVGQLEQPLLFLSSTDDEIVPASHMRRLHRAATSAAVAEIHTFKATHNDIWLAGGPEYWRIKRDFILRHGSRDLTM